MEAEIRLFATFRDYLPKESGLFSFKKIIEQETSVAQIMKEINLPEEIPKMIIINGGHVKDDYVVKDRDIINIFPPVGGG